MCCASVRRCGLRLILSNQHLYFGEVMPGVAFKDDSRPLEIDFTCR